MSIMTLFNLIFFIYSIAYLKATFKNVFNKIIPIICNLKDTQTNRGNNRYNKVILDQNLIK